MGLLLIKNNKLLDIISYPEQTFFKTAKCFTGQCFSTCIRNFTYNTLLFETSSYFVIYQQLLRYHCRALQ